jgi:hypothetical protein
MGGISGNRIDACWYNPQNRQATKIIQFRNSGTVTFNPPGNPTNGNNWVLVLDDVSKKFPAPGADFN